MGTAAQELWTAYIVAPTEANFAAFYEATKGYVYTICYRVLRNDEDEATDAFQSTFLNLIALAQNRPEAESVKDIDVLVRRLAVREADKRRKRSVRRTFREVAEEVLARVADSRPAADEVTSDRQVRELVDTIVQTLPDPYRIPLQLHFFHGMTHQEIADTLGQGRSTVTKTIQKGLQRLEPLLRRAGLGEAGLALSSVVAAAVWLQPPSAIAASALLSEAGGIISAGGLLPAASVSEVLGSAPSLTAGGSTLAGVKGVVVAAAVATGVLGLVVLAPWRPSPPPTQPAGSPTSAGQAASTGESGTQKARPVGSGVRPVSGGVSSPQDGESPLGVKAVFVPSPNLPSLQPVSLAEGMESGLVSQDRPTTGPRVLVTGGVSYPDGQPAAGARVVLVRRVADSEPPGVVEWVDDSTTAGLDGQYRLETVDGAGLCVRAWTSPLFLVEAPLSSPPDEGVQGENAALPPETRLIVQDLVLQSPGGIEGRVTDLEGRPIGGALVQAVGLNQESNPLSWALQTRADQGGWFSLDLSPIRWGRARVAASSPGYVSDGVLVSIPQGGVVLRLDDVGASLEGRVFRKADGRPVGGARVRALAMAEGSWTDLRLPPIEARADNDGVFQLDGLASGRWVLEAQHGELRSTGYEEAGACRVEILRGEYRPGISLLLHPTHFLEGRIADSFDNPIEAVRVVALSDTEEIWGTVRTDKAGRYRLSELPPGPVALELRHEEYLNRTVWDIAVDRDDADFVLTAEGRVTLVGRVIDRKTHEPVKSLEVKEDSGIRSTPDPTIPGQFTVADLVPGQTCRFLIRVPGYPDLATDPVVIPSGVDRVDQTFEIGRGGTVVGRIRSIYTKEPLPGVALALERPGGRPVLETVSDEAGRFDFSGVGRGRYTVAARPESPWVERTLPAVVDDGQTADIGELELNRLGTVRGRLIRVPEETGIAGEPLELQTAAIPTVWSAVTGPQGEFEFTGLPEVRNSIFLLQYQLLSTRVDLSTQDTREITIALGNSTLQGHVFREGRPCREIARIRIFSVGDQYLTRNVATDKAGWYQLEGIPPGRWRVVVEPRIPAFAEQSLTDFVDLGPGETLGRDYILPSGRLVGRAVSETGEPAAGARISVRPVADTSTGNGPPLSSRNLVARDDGSFEVEGLAPGEYEVVAGHGTSGAFSSERVEVALEGDTPPLLLRMKQEETGTVESVALDYASRKGVPTAWCRLTRIDPSGASAAVVFGHNAQRALDGVMTIRGVPVGTYEAEVSAFGYSFTRHTIRVESGKRTTLEDVLYEAGAVRWTLTDRSGLPLDGVPCRLDPADPASIEDPRQARTNAQGLFVVRGLSPGYYILQAEYEERTVREKVLVNAHDLTELTTRVSGVTSSANAAPAAAAP